MEGSIHPTAIEAFAVIVEECGNENFAHFSDCERQS
jgi:hypothetical protein